VDSKTLNKISYGLYVVSSVQGDRHNGQIANTVFQITSEPPTIAVSINKENLTHEYIESSGLFTVSILSKEAPMPFIGQFGFKTGREVDKFKGVGYRLGANGCPVVLDNVTGYLEARVEKAMDVGTHTIFAGLVTDAQSVSNGEPMTYAYYHEVKRGTAPKTAPTYIKDREKEAKEATKLDKYTCTVCGYVYDPGLGDPDASIAPGTAFEDLPEDWVCPICGSGKDEFEKVG
jgi:flavin reductase (DIM6/NTAB) family NADH-FMN oxidoreductase RutF/rubredoxin